MLTSATAEKEISDKNPEEASPKKAELEDADSKESNTDKTDKPEADKDKPAEKDTKKDEAKAEADKPATEVRKERVATENEKLAKRKIVSIDAGRINISHLNSSKKSLTKRKNMVIQISIS